MPPSSPAVALTIAGTDSGGGAGIAADLRTFAAHGVHGTLAVTTVTAQDTVGMREALPMPAELVRAQVEAVVADLRPGAAKTGMLPMPATVAVVAELAKSALPALVVDPVLVDSSGSPLFAGTHAGGVEMLEAVRDLLSYAAVATPNLPEAALLLGRQLDGLEGMEVAARELQRGGARLVVVTGGRSRLGDESVDVAFDGESVTVLRAPYVPTVNVHGTGCSFAAAITAGLALGWPPLVAARRAKDFVHRAIELAADWRLGAGHGPIDQIGAGRSG